MRDFVAEHGGELIVIFHALENALIEADLAAGQHEGIGLVALKDRVFPRLVLQPGRLHELRPDRVQPAA